jgi:hypothetical protein
MAEEKKGHVKMTFEVEINEALMDVLKENMKNLSLGFLFFDFGLFGLRELRGLCWSFFHLFRPIGSMFSHSAILYLRPSISRFPV